MLLGGRAQFLLVGYVFYEWRGGKENIAQMFSELSSRICSFVAGERRGAGHADCKHAQPAPDDMFQQPQRIISISCPENSRGCTQIDADRACFHPPWRATAHGELEGKRHRTLEKSLWPSAPPPAALCVPAFFKCYVSTFKQSLAAMQPVGNGVRLLLGANCG